ncbi:MAG TPA: hypothetical protein VGB17_02925 [Pyrinomonadaceae bacterium]|jgi:hypothetical protein
MNKIIILVLVLAITAITSLAQQPNSEWTFPSQGMQGIYDERLKGVVYDLGDGFYGSHVKVRGVPVVVVTLAKGAPQEMSDADLTLLVASKTIRLHPTLKDALQGHTIGREYKFKTFNGRIAGVTLSHDRKTAIVRIIEAKKKRKRP